MGIIDQALAISQLKPVHIGAELNAAKRFGGEIRFAFNQFFEKRADISNPTHGNPDGFILQRINKYH